MTGSSQLRNSARLAQPQHQAIDIVDDAVQRIAGERVSGCVNGCIDGPDLDPWLSCRMIVG
jgi:hypothetical protein